MLEDNPYWYKDAIIYQLHIKSFMDSNGDGIGDFPGLTSKLDYLASLNINTLWLLPFYVSPMKDDGYDIADYNRINPIYGSIKDFKQFLHAAHSRGMRVITELVINHTSDQHPWFQRARKAKPNSPWRNFYVWSDTTDKFADTRIIFKDFETSNWAYDPVAKAYYWHRFYSHQPDLNFDNPLVHKEIFKALDFWFDMGVDGLRLDAIPYLYEREGSTCENLPETHAFIKKLRKHVDENHKNKMLLAEANQWPEDVIHYFGDSDECHMALHFPIMPRLYLAIRMEDPFSLRDIIDQTPRIPEDCQWALFLRNHDELTLEMVSDEERDYMYRMYAKDTSTRINLGIRRRLAPLLENDKNKIELMNILLLSLPGSPIIYYGDEIGMGDNHYLGDRNGVRTPMQWANTRNAGFSTANPQKLFLPLIIDPEYHYEIVNVENQENNFSSLLWWMRRVLAVRQKNPAFGKGNIEFISCENPKILAFTRTYENTSILVITNLSRFPQATELDLSNYKGITPRELFHQERFPTIHNNRYTVTLNPYGYFWLSLSSGLPLEEHSHMTVLKLKNNWTEILYDPFKERFENEILPQFLATRHWFNKDATIQQVNIKHRFAIDGSYIIVIEVSFVDDLTTACYNLPISFYPITPDTALTAEIQRSIIAKVEIHGKQGLIIDSLHDQNFHQALFRFIINTKRAMNKEGSLQGFITKKIERETKDVSAYVKSDRGNSSIQFGQSYFLKLYRKFEEGLNPDMDMDIYLSEHSSFKNVPPFIGGVVHTSSLNAVSSIAILEEYVPHNGTGKEITKEYLTRFFENVIVDKSTALSIEERMGSFVETVALLAKRTAEFHLALAQETDNPDFTPEPFTAHYQRSIYQRHREQIKRSFILLRKISPDLDIEEAAIANTLVKQENFLIEKFQNVVNNKINATRIRIHGNYHLGQILFTGKDFCLIDFEGEPTYSLTIRKSKRSPLKDIAAMLYSFLFAGVQFTQSDTMMRTIPQTEMQHWISKWYKGVKSIFLKNYYVEVEKVTNKLLPVGEQRDLLIDLWMTEKAAYQLSYDHHYRPEILIVPLQCFQHLLM